MKIRFAPMWALLCIVAACSDDPATPGGSTSSTLSASEALGLAAAYLETVWGLESQTRSRLQFSMAADTTAHQMESSIPCGRGGVVALATQDTVIFDQVGPTMRINIGGTHTPVNCGLSAAATNVTINGSPHFRFASHAAIIGGMPSGNVVETLKGDFAWSAAGGRSGSCHADYRRTVNPLTGNETLTGTICGYTFTF